ncbi:MAG: wax ester/triacylglycerol synthase family O-acyltransferase [Acidobacteriia bacterium]|nr:wax ester/triacylglycerol synthase family O-acyltransferase [Terriglobia bacterium]
MKSAKQALGQNRRLTGVDAAFLYLDRKEIPMNIAGVMIFEGEIPFDDFLAHVESKLPLIPRYRQVVVEPPFNLGYPTWEDDRYFDIHKHVFHTRLDPPGGQAELETLASRVVAEVMDRGKPLWDMYVVDGVKGGRGALIARAHHSLADGISGAAILRVIFDPTPEFTRPPASKQRFRPRLRKPETPKSLTDLIRESAVTTAKNLIAAEKGLLAMTEAIMSGSMQSGLQAAKELLPELAAASERLPFNRPCTGARSFLWTECDLKDVQAIRAAAGGGRVNDVILTMVTRAIARYVKLHGETAVRRFIRVVCPVNLRVGDNGESLGNQITFMPVALPLDIRDPLEMVRAVALRTEVMKNAGSAQMVALLAAWICAAPPPLQALFWAGLSRFTFPVPVLNLICTNIPGSPTPLYACGKRMLTSYPHVPTGYELGVNIAAQSYDGKLFFGFTSDTDAAPDAHRLRDFVHDAYQELRRAAGVKKPRRAATRPARKPESMAAPADPEPAPEARPETPPEPAPAAPPEAVAAAAASVA